MTAASGHRLRKMIAACSIAMLFTGAAARSGADTDAWRFQVMLDDKPIGHHDFVVHRTANGERVEIEARFDVTFLRIPVYTYRHTNTETWRDGCLRRLESQTDDDGEEISVSARQEQGRMVIETDDEVQVVERPCVKSFAYWNRDIIDDQRLLNAQTGEMVPVTIEPVEATTSLADVDASALDAYRIASDDGEVRIEIAYARDSGRWVYLESTLENDRVLRYVPGDAAAALNDDAKAKRS